MSDRRLRGNVPHEKFVADTLYDILQELKKTNTYLLRIANVREVYNKQDQFTEIQETRKKKSTAQKIKNGLSNVIEDLADDGKLNKSHRRKKK